MNDIESQLRATLDEQAGHAPRGEQLAGRILAEVQASARVLRPRRGWSTWTMPLLAAGAVASVVAAVVGVSQLRHSAAPERPAVSHQLPSPTHAVHRSAAPSATGSPSVPVTSSGTDVAGFQALDLTFVSENQGWALGRARCVSGPGTCSALFRSTDGRNWTSMPGAAFNVPGVKNCTAPCVDHIRFATPDVGYVYSSAAFFMTTDGGSHWTYQPGRGAEALETLDGNVIRLVSDGTGCPGPCNVRAQTARIGSSAWVTVPLQPGGLSSVGVQLVRSGSDAYVLSTKNPTGGAANQTSTLFVSTYDGASWQKYGEPCPQPAPAGRTAEVDSTAVAAAAGGTVSVLCASRDGTSPTFVAVSHDRGAHFARAPGSLPPRSVHLLAGDPTSVLVAASDGAYRSTDGGAHWARIPDLSRSVSFLGFESARVGRAVTAGGRTIWTTTDRGRTWQSFEFR